MLHLRRPARLGEATALRHALGDWALARRLPADLIADLQLAGYEAMTNVVEHAYAAGSAGHLDLHAQHGIRAVRVTVTDRGRWRLQPDPAPGRGLPLIHLLADHSDVTPTPKGTVVAMSWQLPYQPS
ncbi:ATP-binding protein [Amycolatopsis sp. FDAARGOS 1241]|uniref:ATP-binding protein n=1 Tax=Amycolatopsis sp. FDAARGOS 1241 TaxID=2778070 RepID=UPI001EF399D5|nr:ATP-binding protein [Amycolatopsis sp. FDAARGOS 1241]